MTKTKFTDDDIKKLVKENDVQFIQLQFVDINGLVKNLTIPSEHIDKILENDMMLDGSSIKGFRKIETSDMCFWPDKNTFQILPWQQYNGKKTARLICDIHNPDGTPFAGCPRCNLKYSNEYNYCSMHKGEIKLVYITDLVKVSKYIFTTLAEHLASSAATSA